MSGYHLKFESEATASEFCNEENARPAAQRPWGMEWRPVEVRAGCPHAEGGWFAVLFNDCGYSFSGAPWEACDSCEWLRNELWSCRQVAANQYRRHHNPLPGLRAAYPQFEFMFSRRLLPRMEDQDAIYRTGTGSELIGYLMITDRATGRRG
jgi:hypothetical protein